MSNTTPELTPEQSLQLIRKTIEIAKRKVQENGFHLRLWGWLVIIASAFDFYQDWQVGPANHQHLSWLAIMPVGLLLSVGYEWRRQRTKLPRTIVNQWYSMIWLGFGIALLLILVAAIQLDVPPTPGIMAMVGFALFMSGIILEFRPLIWGAAVIWIGAGACIFSGAVWHSLITAICIGLGYLIPGYMLRGIKKI